MKNRRNTIVNGDGKTRIADQTLKTTGKGNGMGKTAAKTKGGVKKLWDKPVSQSFYAKLIERARDIFLLLGYPRGWGDEFMKLIDLYLNHGECPQRLYNEEFVLAVFYSLKGEIDAAVARSAASRRRAAERRARKEAERSAGENKNRGEESRETTPEVKAVCGEEETEIGDVKGINNGNWRGIGAAEKEVQKCRNNGERGSIGDAGKEVQKCRNHINDRFGRERGKWG